MRTIVTEFEKVIEELKKQNRLDKKALIEPNFYLSYEKLYKNILTLATKVIEKTNKNEVVGIVTNRGVSTVVAMFACIYANNPYVVIDVESSKQRVNKIIEVAKPKLILVDKHNQNQWDFFQDIASICVDITYNDACYDKSLIKKRLEKMVSTDPLYVLFTSGSTGIPKGTVVSHLNVVSYIEWFKNCFQINQETIFASQTPFYFSMSVSDVFSTLLSGASIIIVPKSYFSFPVKLFEMMNTYQVNTIYWVPSAYQIISQMHLLDYCLPQYLKLAMFAGEIMPVKVLNDWMDKLPNVKFANLFGPTETTDICTYYKVDRRFANEESLPIGKACENLEVFLLNEKNELVSVYDKTEGELYVKGAFVAMGYYNNPQKTSEAFVQNPLNPHYSEIVYKTGDICKYNDKQELIYLCRKDFQIKHMGYRIELGEIETLCNSLDGIQNAFCLYDSSLDEIICCYVGTMDTNELISQLKIKMPYYMLPSRYEKLSMIQLNQNGKIDRHFYQEKYSLNR